MDIEKNLNKELVNYIKQNIFPIYRTFDKGHDLEHISQVIKRAFKISKNFNIDMNILYVIAVYHDIGIKISRKNHAMYSGEIARSDNILKGFFNIEEIELIAQAVEDHSTSKGIEPRSIYGKIVCDADKDDNIETALLRAYEFTKSYFSDFTEEECFENIYTQLCSKYGKDGKVRFWIDNFDRSFFIQKMMDMTEDKDLFNNNLQEIINKKSKALRR